MPQKGTFLFFSSLQRWHGFLMRASCSVVILTICDFIGTDFKSVPTKTTQRWRGFLIRASCSVVILTISDFIGTDCKSAPTKAPFYFSPQPLSNLFNLLQLSPLTSKLSPLFHTFVPIKKLWAGYLE